MAFRELSVSGSWEITPKPHGDSRGMFFEWFNESGFAEMTGHAFDMRQANCSVSARGVLRGLHFAQVPPSQAKYVTCVKGSVFDVVVDIRIGSPTYGRWDSVLLDDVDRNLDAITDELPHLDTDIETDSAWPRLSAHVVEQTPVRGMLGFRLLVDGRKAGALNVFSDTPGALTERSIDQATVLAAFASVALMAGSARQQATDLQTALHSNREIGKAVGLLMAAHKVPQERAFEILDRTSQELNIKLSEVAKRVVQGQEQQFRRGS